MKWVSKNAGMDGRKRRTEDVPSATTKEVVFRSVKPTSDCSSSETQRFKSLDMFQEQYPRREGVMEARVFTKESKI